MGKKAKEHKKKVAKRNAKINEQKKKTAMDFLMKLINKEKERGAFDNPVQPTLNIQDTNPLPSSTPLINTDFAGPQI